jgi:hypothetical protein
MTAYAQQYLVALGLTLVIEVPIYAVGLVLIGVDLLKAVGLGVLVNLITHPNVWFTLPGLLEPRLGHSGFLAVAEAFAWLVEALLLGLFLRRRIAFLLGLSFVANASSALIGGAILGSM